MTCTLERDSSPSVPAQVAVPVPVPGIADERVGGIEELWRHSGEAGLASGGVAVAPALRQAP
jgi:hypothetical protein